ncbi:rCG48000, isoform CRA_a [Rattus norvegicus]|uniref:RCG48000, isoform CRA_a n=1 Tax=Rattus norvegicus TaxID=10116 RepID=A6I0S2_RAT|nr:rCG48000, isoform CRA_a [Rattus norvegicus]
MWAVVAAEKSPFTSPTREQADSRTLMHRVVLEKSNFPRITQVL